ncbi:MAG: ABC transporter permease [Roseivirga sp.]|nr:ABC transporter permease [Roseivirga sp.]
MNENQDHINPPSWSLRLLRLFIRKDYLEEIEGDMEEVFYDDLETYSPGKSRRRYSWQALKLLRPAIIKTISGSQKLNYLGMLQHNLLITLRGFKRHKTTFLINLIGLSTGLAASLLIFLWVNDERSVDTFHEKDNQLYWAMTHFELTNNLVTWDYTSGRLGRTMVENFPEVEDAVWIGNGFYKPKGVISYGEGNYETHGLYASSNFFELLTYSLLSGNAQKVLANKESIVISEETAVRIFGTVEAAVGKTINLETRLISKEFIVSGVFEAPPSNATLQFELVINYDNLIETDKWADEWNGGYAQTYLVLKQGTDIEAFNAKIENFMDDKVNNERFSVFVQKYSDYYLHGKYKEGTLVGGRAESVRLFTIVAILILVIASINFMNLSTAQANKKMKEIGVKKAIGANRLSLIIQFMFETLLISFLALLASSILVYLLLPEFNLITGKNIVLNIREHLPLYCWTVFITGVLAGSYPAFYLSGFNPVAVLKGKISNIKGEEFVRKGLVVVQFTLSIIFIIGVIVINQQIEFTQSKNLGYDRNNVITFRSKGLDRDQVLSFVSRLKEIPGIESSGNMAGDFLWGEDSGSGYWTPQAPENRQHLFKSPKMGYDVIETLGLNIVEGRSFDPKLNEDENRIIINQSAAKLLGLENAAGTRINYGKSNFREVIGVVEDFQYGSMHQAIEPMVIRFREWGSDCIVKLKQGAEVNTIDRIEKLYKEFHEKYAFEATYLEDDYMALYESEEKESVLSNYMAGAAIIISCLGLFGLATFTAERRTKEIGIRKILGASQTVIIRLLTGSFTKTVVISIVLALPLGYLAVSKWLENFAYAVELRWWIFVLAGLSCLVIAWLTVGFQTFKSATMNPIHCLRDE